MNETNQQSSKPNNDLKPVWIGCDPAFRKSGFAICILDHTGEVAFKIFKNGFIDFQKWLMSDDRPQKAIVGIENSDLQKTIFVSHKLPNGGFVSAKKARFIKGSRKMTNRELLSYASKVGKNQATSILACDLFIAVYGEQNVIQLSPRQKGGKIEDDRLFRAYARANKHKLTSYKGNKNEQDKRDAYQCLIVAKEIYRKLQRKRSPK